MPTPRARLVIPAVFLLAAGPLAAQPAAVRLTFAVPEDSLEQRTQSLPDGSEITHVDIRGLEPKLSQPTPGLPELPFTYRHVVIPGGARITGVGVKPGKTITHRGVNLIGWTQKDQPMTERPPVPPVIPIDIETRETLYRARPDATPLDPAFARQEVWPSREQVVLEGVDEKAGLQVVKLLIHPVQWYPGTGILRFNSTLDITIEYEGGKSLPSRKSYRHAMELQQVSRLVSNKADVPAFNDWYPSIPADIDAWYLIITDNFAWNAEEIEKGSALPGDMVAEFSRLADWKTQKGVQAAVVTISDIVAGDYGNFTTGARDLQEVLRRFIQHAHAEFNTSWVLLGGDVAVIPARYVVLAHSSDDSFYPRESASKPEVGMSYWHETSDTVRIHSRGNIAEDTPIITHATGHAFHRVSNPAAGTPGWAYATSDSYSTVSATPTEFVILRGSLANTREQDFYVSASTNTIPTDLYYSSLEGPDYGVSGKHDWDKNNNGIYGQFHGETALDGVDFQSDVSLGRAPVQTGAEAKVFVDKVLVYEKHEGIDSSFAHKLLLGSGNWSSSPAVIPDSSSQPAAGKYYSASGSTTALLHFDGAPDSQYAWRLVAFDAPGQWWVVPYNPGAGAQSLGWFYCTSASYSTVSQIEITLWGASILLPLPTAYVKVRGPAGEIHPAKFFFNRLGMDRAPKEKEELKDQFEGDFPELDDRKRLYSDLIDVPDYPAPDLFELSSTLMEAELTTGYNIVTLSGHGNANGCCGMSSTYVKNLTNGSRAGVVYANSCLTGKFDASDCVGEEFLKNPNGGAVAYIGYTRFGWVKAGGSFENTFWKSMADDRHLGRMHNSRALLATGGNGRWSNFALNLLGDPEMEVWVDTPPYLHVDIPVEVAWGLPLPIWMRGESLVRVSVLGPGGRLEIHHTGASDMTSFATRSFQPGDTLLVTVTKPGFVPYQRKVKVTGEIAAGQFIRGDANLDLKIDISDALYLLGALFLGERSLSCEDAADANDDGAVDISDARTVLDFLFLGGALPPGTTAGQPQSDTTRDDLGCEGAPARGAR